MTTELITNGKGAWLRRWRAFGLVFAVGKGCGVKAKWPGKGCEQAKAVNGRRKTNLMANAHRHKERIYEQQRHKCWLCHREFPQRKLQMHHILPLHYFPKLGGCRDNLMLLCPDCHRHMHNNPLLMATLIREKAALLGVDASQPFLDDMERISKS